MFDENFTFDVRGVFLDVFKAFENDGLLFKLKAYGVQGELLSLLKNHLQKREQIVVLNSQISD